MIKQVHWLWIFHSKCPHPRKVAVTCIDSNGGRVTTDKTEYWTGDTVVLTVEGDPGYYCSSLTVNGKELTAATDGTYSFVATETTYEVNATFTEISDTELFYINEKKTEAYDPFVLDNTAQDKYYYMYGTGWSEEGAIQCYRSTNLMDWDPLGYAIDKTVYDMKVSDVKYNPLYTSVWAPEVVYDDNTQTYYMFFSAMPYSATTGDVDTDKQNNASYVMMVATSKSPDKGYSLVDFTDVNSCGTEKSLHTYNTSEYDEYFAKYSYFDPEKLAKKCQADKEYSAKRGGYIPAIDPHPYLDENGEKYLFWVDQEDDDRICAIQMKDKNWLTPNWDTFTVLTWAGYYTKEDYDEAQGFWSFLVAKVPYDKKGAANDYYINEAPEVIKHDGKYYLTYSTGAYATDTYQVIQAVYDPGDTDNGPLGTYTKLNETEGAILLSSKNVGNTEVTGAGHHSFVAAGDKLYMVYHRHNTPYLEGDNTTGGGNRNHAIDEVKWITNSKGLPIMYVNGATSTLQPRLDAFSTYKNIADKAEVSANKTTVSNIEYLNDGLLSINNDEEATITEETTFTFNLNTPNEVRGIMIYNSKNRANIFTKISKIEVVFVVNGVEVTRTIDNVEFDSAYYTNDYVTLGAAAYAKFAYMNVKSIKITVDVPEGQDKVGISEVKILGR